MGKIQRKLLLSFLAVFMVCLITSISTTTVTAAANWGTLKAGDEMQWQSTKWGTVKMKVLNVEGKTITIDYEGRGDKETHTIDADASIYDPGMSDISPWLTPKSDLEEMGLGIQSYEFEGTSYKAYYSKNEFGDGSTDEDWRDFNTGILFEHKFTDATEGTVEVTNKLISTNADLAEATGGGGGGGCLGTIVIAMFSITTAVAYSVIHYRKKKSN